MTNRIRPIEGTVNREFLAPETHLFWDPVTDQGHIRFLYYDYIVKESGEVIARTDEPQYMEVDFEDIKDMWIGEGATDPVTEADLGVISAAGIKLLFKMLFDKLHNEEVVDNGPMVGEEDPMDDEGEPEVPEE